PFLGVVVRRPLVDEVGTGGEQRLAVQRHAVGEVPHYGARLGIAERMAAVLHRHALDAAREVGLPVLAFGLGLFLGGEVVPPAQLLQQHVIVLGVAGGDYGVFCIRFVIRQMFDASL